jgi:CHAT domain-containing protein/tetratricopeptide (TPR) repeat protein
LIACSLLSSCIAYQLAERDAEVRQLYAEGRFSEAIPVAVRQVQESERVFGPEHPQVATALAYLAALYQASGQYELAEPLAERALAIYEKTYGIEHPAVAASLNNLAALHLATGDYAGALPLLEQSLAIREETLGPEHPDVGQSLGNLAVVHHHRGEYQRAVLLEKRSLAIQERALGPEDRDVALSLNHLAALHHDMGDYARAEPLYERSLAIWEKKLGPDHPDVARSLNNLAELKRDRGDYARAEPLYERSLALWEKRLGPEHPEVATSLSNLGGLYHEMGDYARAQPLYERSLAIREKTLGPEHPDVAMSLNNLAGLYHMAGEHEESARLHGRALAIREQALGPEHPDVAMSLSNLAALHHDVGDLARAVPLAERSLAIREAALGREHPDVALDLNNLGGFYYAMGDYAAAAPLLERSLAIQETALGPEHPVVAATLSNYARLQWARGERRRAEETLLRATWIEEQNIGLVAAGGSEDQVRAYLATLTDSSDVLFSLQRADPTSVSLARAGAETVLRRKGRALDAASGGYAALRRSLAPDEQELLEELLSRRARLAHHVLRGPGDRPVEANRTALATLRLEVDEAERAALRRGGALRGAVAPVRLEEVQSRIPDDAALVELVAYREFKPSPPRGESSWGSERYGAYLLRRDSDPVWADLGEAARIDAQVQAFRTALQTVSPGGQVALRARGADVRTTGRALYDTLLAPLAPRLEGARFLLVAPDGVLNLIPFSAVMDPKGRHLVERYTLTHLTSGRDLLRFDGARPPRGAPVVLAAPDYGAVSTAAKDLAARSPQTRPRRRSSDLTWREWEPLPGARLEGETIEKLLGVEALGGAKARESALKQLHGPRLLHIATHGFFLPDQKISQPQPPGPGLPAKGENPLLRSGLVLAGANHLSDGDEDGILTALEMAGLDLSGTQLVVLSACDTGLGTVPNGEGVYGLRRAVVMAGAEAQLTSLWKVSDDVTRKLMVAYYQRLLAGEGRSEALRAVQLEMLEDAWLRHPYYWASFVPIGAWEALPRPSGSGE